MYTMNPMRKTNDILPKGRKYDLFRDMRKRADKTQREWFTAYNLRQTPRGFSRNAMTLRRDLDELSEEGLVTKGERLKRIETYKPDDPSSLDLTGRIISNSKARRNDLLKLRLLTRYNTHFECLDCGRFFKAVRLLLFPPLRLCPHCFSNSRFSLGIKTRPDLFL